MKRLLAVLASVALSLLALADEQAKPVIKSESFDRDPEWEGHNNRIVPKVIPTVAQAFGYSDTHFAGKKKGEIGGQVWRSTTPAYYGADIGKKTLADKPTATGTFALTASTGSSGVFFGWFSS